MKRLLITGIILCSMLGYGTYYIIFKPNVLLHATVASHLYIRTGAGIDDVLRSLKQGDVVENETTFLWLAKILGLRNNIHPGHYLLHPEMSNEDLLRLLISGKQQPIRLSFQNIRTRNQFAHVVSKQIEPDSMAILQVLSDSAFLHQYGLTPENVLVLFIPDTYEFYWNANAKQFVEKLGRRYLKYWNDERRKQAADIGLSPVQVSILASIVEQETNRNDEKAIIAGVYMNRLRRNWKLEADPTLVYALGDFSINRVLKAYKEIASPYNTYKYVGLPPGPICIPSAGSIEAVLHCEKHDYMYFCAKDDFSGYHRFATSFSQHLDNARRFQRELNRRNIKS